MQQCLYRILHHFGIRCNALSQCVVKESFSFGPSKFSLLSPPTPTCHPFACITFSILYTSPWSFCMILLCTIEHGVFVFIEELTHPEKRKENQCCCRDISILANRFFFFLLPIFSHCFCKLLHSSKPCVNFYHDFVKKQNVFWFCLTGQVN